MFIKQPLQQNRTSLKASLKAYYIAITFSPTWLGMFVNPFWLCRRELALALADMAPRLTGKVLDFGSGSQPYRPLLTNCARYTSLEYDTPQNRERKVADIFYNGQSIPAEDNSFDGLLSTQTLEHVPNPDVIVAEWARVLKDGGMLLITMPFMWPEHEMPYDFQRYSSGGLRLVLEKSGFEIVEQRRLLSDCRAPAQLFLAWIFDSVLAKCRPKALRFVLIPLMCTPISILASVLAVIFPKNSNTYLDNLVLARRNKTASEN
ncbi:MAG: class I SAM-dependent methyltransferase [Gallionella sp.]|jgi:SAM-dependent methyltransferase